MGATGQSVAALADAMEAIPTRSVVIDAELVLPDADGVPDFADLRVAGGNIEPGVPGRSQNPNPLSPDLAHCWPARM
jgi:ATP-dependent DNA ligase